MLVTRWAARLARTVGESNGSGKDMPRIRTDDDVRLYYEEVGTGDPILFLHEFGGHYLSWEPQLRYFSRGYRCISYAARG